MIPNSSFGSSMMVSRTLLVISSLAKFHMNFGFNIIIIASPDISSMNGASAFINFHSLGFHTIGSFGKIGQDLFKKLK